MLFSFSFCFLVLPFYQIVLSGIRFVAAITRFCNCRWYAQTKSFLGGSVHSHSCSIDTQTHTVIRADMFGVLLSCYLNVRNNIILRTHIFCFHSFASFMTAALKRPLHSCCLYSLALFLTLWRARASFFICWCKFRFAYQYYWLPEGNMRKHTFDAMCYYILLHCIVGQRQIANS